MISILGLKRGELGDDMDFIEWSATVEMMRNLQSQIDSLD